MKNEIEKVKIIKDLCHPYKKQVVINNINPHNHQFSMCHYISNIFMLIYETIFFSFGIVMFVIKLSQLNMDFWFIEAGFIKMLSVAVVLV
jgi:hypothetical protein